HARDAHDFVQFAKAMDVRGASVTIPYKVALLSAMDCLDPGAEAVGAINTIDVRAGRSLGLNTDTIGFLGPLQDRVITLTGVRAAVLGAGGSARAAASALVQGGASVTVHARRSDRAEQVCRLAGARVGEWPPAPGSWDLLVNCTPVGMHP